MNTAETCICTGLNTYIMVITLDNAVNTVPRRIERKVKAGSPSSLADTRNLDTSNPERMFSFEVSNDSAIEGFAYHS